MVYFWKSNFVAEYLEQNIQKLEITRSDHSTQTNKMRIKR
jgi:hypothetical protein